MQSPAGAPSLLSLSVDVEDWYMGIEMPLSRWPGFPPRLERGLRPLLELLKAAGQRGTFFILGAVAERHPEAIAEIAAGGHEIGSHGWSHTKVYDLTRPQFEDEVRRTDELLLRLTGQKPVGFRAPYFSITEKSLWALDVLKDHGYRYDTSIYPGSNYRYGIPGSSHTVYRLENGLIEFPVSTFAVGKRRIGIGGAYLRILPLSVTRSAIDQRLERRELSTVYVHPWELDPGHPWVKFRARAMLTHYFALHSTRGKIRGILARYPTVPMLDLLEAHSWLEQ